MSGKGDARRPALVSDGVVAANWERIFQGGGMYRVAGRTVYVQKGKGWKVLKMHPTPEKAEAHYKALMANVPEAKGTMPMHEQGMDEKMEKR